MKTDNLVIFSSVILLCVIIFGINAIGFYRQEVILCKVDSKERMVTSSGNTTSSKFMVYCESEVVQNTDELLAMKFNSADLQRDLKVGSSYKIRVCGWRIPFLSMFRNIIKIETGKE